MCAHLAHGLSWVLLAFVALSAGVSSLSGPALAWIHIVALGWLTMAALGILVHVVPAFTDASWRCESIARGALVPFAVGLALFVIGWLVAPALVVTGSCIVTAAFICYYAPGIATLRHAKDAGRTEAAIGRALSINLSFFLFVCLLGVAMSLSIAYGWFPALLSRAPAIHANIALYGWLTMLVFGVSARTMRPICGVRTRFPRVHAVAGIGVLCGPMLVAGGIGAYWPVMIWIGAALLAAGIACYALDAFDVVRRATVRHRPPQAFVTSAVVCLLASSVFGLGTMLGKPWANAYVFVILVGWIGQMVNAHFLHIGVRLIATVVRGEDDETRPEALLDGRLSWLTFAAVQCALASCTYGIWFEIPGAVAAGAACGFVAWCALGANAFMVANSAKAQKGLI